MTEEQSYTTEEIAKLLKISKLTVYDLIKKGDLVAYRVGKQMRIDATDLEAYKRRSKQLQSPAQQSTGVSGSGVNQQAAGPIGTQEQHYDLTNRTQEQHTSSNILAGQGEVQYTAHTTGAAVSSASQMAPSSYFNSPAGFGQNSASATRHLVITGQDVSLDILMRHIEKQSRDIRPLRSFMGSLDGLISMYRGESDLVSTHLLDGDTGEYNLPYIRKILTGWSYVVVNLLTRPAGLYVPRGNPLQLNDWTDLNRSGLRLANREKGSGARVLLDEQLRLNGISAAGLLGYDVEETSHMGVAAKVSSGEADVGVGIEKAARLVGQVDFIPLVQERYDLVMLRKQGNEAWIESVLRILQSPEFQQELKAFEGYDVSRTGEILYEA
ncbi:helix-turn-helix transcriptional regulator [Paenibacillus barcinonensis]|uniref:substrate-binding domain-containing protein n=1 Tax=Paenibacillus barcinonensis TaxID=198119 RepID=UPI001C0FCD02|nr:helix-turn-helix transcriptional regulator [Paenibacillus barcinonensis]MBU5355877.1 helix-turn-helix transcriptional regulator [Paenibacillus barcinonensis]